MSGGEARFPRTARIVTPEGYRRVFQGSRRSVDSNFTVLYLVNGSDRSRLGLAVAKKVLKRAVDRNLVKRLIRESFRHHQEQLAGFDLVVLCRRGLALEDRSLLTQSLERHWKRVAREDKNQ